MKNLLLIVCEEQIKVSFSKRIHIDSFEYEFEEFYTKDILSGLEKFSKLDYSHLIILRPERWIDKSLNLDLILSKCISSLAEIEHYAISQPAIVYGKLLKEHQSIVSQTKTHTYIRHIDDAFLVIKGLIIKNFPPVQFMVGTNIDWSKYREEINLFGYETYRINSVYLEVEKNKELLIPKIDSYDSIDLVNRSYLNKTYDIGIEFSYLAPIYNGTSEYATSILSWMVKEFQEKRISFQIIADTHVIRKFKLEEYSGYFVDPAKSEENFYKLLFIPQQVYSVAALEKINKICFKFVFTMLDVIALRCRYLGDPRGLDIASSISYKYAENVLGLSKASSRDIELYFEERSIYKKVVPILLTKEMESTIDNVEKNSEFSEKDYILVMGNAYKHKAIEKALNELYNTKFNFVILGDELSTDKLKKRFKVFPSGILSNSHMDSLYKNSNLILYPSLYEGFGLPVIAALQLGKKILVYDSDVNRELKAEFDKNNLIYFFNSFEDLSQMIEEILNTTILEKLDFTISRKWNDVSRETTNFLLEDLKSSIDFNLLNQRIYDVKEIRKILENSHWIKLHHFKFLAKLLLEIFLRKIRWYLGTFKKFLLGLVGHR